MISYVAKRTLQTWLRQESETGHVILDYQGGTDVITGVLFRSQECQTQGGPSDAITRRGPQPGHAGGVASRSWREQETDPPLVSLEGT